MREYYSQAEGGWMVEMTTKEWLDEVKSHRKNSLFAGVLFGSVGMFVLAIIVAVFLPRII